MGTSYSSGLNTDNSSKLTSAQYVDRGDGTIEWLHRVAATAGGLADGALVTLGLKADTAVEGGATTGTLIALIKGVQKALGINTDANVNTGNGYINGILKAIRDTLRTGMPADGTFVTATSGNVANATAAASISGTSAKTGYLTGFEITGGGATAASIVAVTITGLLGGTITYYLGIPAGATVGVSMGFQFCPPLPASAANTAISVSAAAFGAGNTNACTNVHGYKI